LRGDRKLHGWSSALGYTIRSRRVKLPFRNNKYLSHLSQQDWRFWPKSREHHATHTAGCFMGPCYGM
jgi:hypothetical protein